ncbi:MAG TPA: gephyrin-like molybdotransferase Glp, partial [Anaerolineales bacterium]
MSSLLSVSDAQQRLINQFSVLEARRVPLVEAAGRVLAEAVISSFDLPPFSNSSMDGFAVQAADLASARQDQPAALRVVADIPAGSRVQVKLRSGQAARIMTGAPLPKGADAVIPVENTDFSQRQAGLAPPKEVQAFSPVRVGENVRPQGMDVRAGEAVMQPGDRLRPQDIGFLAMLGVAQVKVIRSPRVAIFSTGDELLPVDAPLQEGKIYDSNTYALLAQVEQTGGIALNLGIIADQADAVQNCLDQAAASEVDLILSSAGVSVGAFDFVRNVVEQQGKLDFWRVNMRPGKPVAFGAYKGIPFIGLPGNPVSAFVGF